MCARRPFAWTMTAAAVACFAAFCSVGCSHQAGGGGSADPEAEHLGKLGTWAEAYAKKHGDHPPSSLEKLKAWAEKNENAKDDDFVSTRDHQPYTYVVAHGKAMIYEQEGETHGDTHIVFKVDQGQSTAAKTDRTAVQMMSMGSPGGGGGPGGGPGGPGGRGGAASNPGNPAGNQK